MFLFWKNIAKILAEKTNPIKVINKKQKTKIYEIEKLRNITL